MADYSALPIFTDAWIADTAHLGRAERGLYFDLLVLIWRSPECRVPNDIEWISRKLRCLPDERQALTEVIAEFCKSSGNWLTQKRLRKEWEYVRNRVEKRRGAAKLRWGKEKDGCKSIADAEQTQSTCNAPTPTPTPTPSLKEIDTIVSSKKDPRGCRLPDGWQPDDERFPDALHDRICELIPEPDRGAWVSDQLDAFRDYWRSKTGAAATKLDWDATLHNWLRKELNDVRKRAWGRTANQAARAFGVYGKH